MTVVQLMLLILLSLTCHHHRVVGFTLECFPLAVLERIQLIQSGSESVRVVTRLEAKRRGGLMSSGRLDIIRGRYAAEVSHHLQEIFNSGGAGIWNSAGRIDEEVIQGINVHNVIVSPDRQYVRVQVSILGDTFDRRQAMAWLVENVKSIRYCMAERLTGRRRVPVFTFEEVDFSEYFDTQAELDKLAQSVNLTKDEIISRPTSFATQQKLPHDKSLLTPEEFDYFNARAMTGELMDDLPHLLDTPNIERTTNETKHMNSNPEMGGPYNDGHLGRLGAESSSNSNTTRRVYNKLSDFDRFTYEERWDINDLEQAQEKWEYPDT